MKFKKDIQGILIGKFFSVILSPIILLNIDTVVIQIKKVDRLVLISFLTDRKRHKNY